MAFEALELSHVFIAQLREPVAAIALCDGELARQLRRAASSVSLNLSEGRLRAGRDRKHLYRIAAGSAAETGAALQVAVSWGYVDATVAAEALATLDRLRAMLWRLTH